MTSLFLLLHSPTISATTTSSPTNSSSYSHGNLRRPFRSFNFISRLPFATCCSSMDSSSSVPSGADSSTQSNFCIIEGPDTAQDFGPMEIKEIRDNIRSRRNRIFLLMEEVRRLRVQQRMKGLEFDAGGRDAVDEMPDMPSSIPFLPNLTPRTLKQLYLTSFSFISGIILFGGLIAPVVNYELDSFRALAWLISLTLEVLGCVRVGLYMTCLLVLSIWEIGNKRNEKHGRTQLEVKLGIGGTSYADIIRSLHLPLQLSQVDPIVASFSGGAVGVISCLMLLEANNVRQQEKKRCSYCLGTGYLACARCSASGVVLSAKPISLISLDSDQPLRLPTTERCINCSGAGKVMCPACLCTGMIMASEHDPRIDPFD